MSTPRIILDVRTAEYVIPPGTRVVIERPGGLFREHVTKHENRFLEISRRYGEHTDDHFQFATGNPKWIYLYVLKEKDTNTGF